MVLLNKNKNSLKFCILVNIEISREKLCFIENLEKQESFVATTEILLFMVCGFNMCML